MAKKKKKYKDWEPQGRSLYWEDEDLSEEESHAPSSIDPEDSNRYLTDKRKVPKPFKSTK